MYKISSSWNKIDSFIKFYHNNCAASDAPKSLVIFPSIYHLRSFKFNLRKNLKHNSLLPQMLTLKELYGIDYIKCNIFGSLKNSGELFTSQPIFYDDLFIYLYNITKEFIADVDLAFLCEVIKIFLFLEEENLDLDKLLDSDQLIWQSEFLDEKLVIISGVIKKLQSFLIKNSLYNKHFWKKYVLDLQIKSWKANAPNYPVFIMVDSSFDKLDKYFIQNLLNIKNIFVIFIDHVDKFFLDNCFFNNSINLNQANAINNNLIELTEQNISDDLTARQKLVSLYSGLQKNVTNCLTLSNRAQKEKCFQNIELIKSQNSIQEVDLLDLKIKYELYKNIDQVITVIVNDKEFAHSLFSRLNLSNIKVSSSFSAPVKHSKEYIVLCGFIKIFLNEGDFIVKLLDFLKLFNFLEDQELAGYVSLLERELKQIRRENLTLDDVLRLVTHEKLKNIILLIEEFSSLKNQKYYFADWLKYHLDLFERIYMNYSETPWFERSNVIFKLHQFIHTKLKQMIDSEPINLEKYNQLFLGFIECCFSYNSRYVDNYQVLIITPDLIGSADTDLLILANITPSAIFIEKKPPEIIDFICPQDQSKNKEEYSHILQNYFFYSLLTKSKRIIFSYPVYKNSKINFLNSHIEFLKILGLQESNVFSDILTKLKERNNNILENVIDYPVLEREFLPKRVSITDIRLLKHDPYSFYVKKILNLEELDYYKNNFGTLVHEVLAEYYIDIKNISNTEINSQGKMQLLVDIYNKKIKTLGLLDYVKLIWDLRFKNIATQYSSESILDDCQYSPEITVKHRVFDNFLEIVGRLDLLIKDVDGYSIIDFKTGSIPSTKAIKTGNEPQLLISSWLLSKNKKHNNATKILYYQLSGYRKLLKKEVVYESNLENNLLNYLGYFFLKNRTFKYNQIYYTDLDKPYTHFLRLS